MSDSIYEVVWEDVRGSILDGKIGAIMTYWYYSLTGKDFNELNQRVNGIMWCDNENGSVTFSISQIFVENNPSLSLWSKDFAIKELESPAFAKYQIFRSRKNDYERTPKATQAALFILIKKLDPTVTTWQEGLDWLQNEMDSLL